MQKWVKRHLNIAVLVSLISIAAMGVAYASITYSEVQRLNKEVFGSDSDKSIAVRLGKLETKADDIKESVHRIEEYIVQ